MHTSPHNLKTIRSHVHSFAHSSMRNHSYAWCMQFCKDIIIELIALAPQNRRWTLKLQQPEVNMASLTFLGAFSFSGSCLHPQSVCRCLKRRSWSKSRISSWDGSRKKINCSHTLFTLGKEGLAVVNITLFIWHNPFKKLHGRWGETSQGIYVMKHKIMEYVYVMGLLLGMGRNGQDSDGPSYAFHAYRPHKQELELVVFLNTNKILGVGEGQYICWILVKSYR